MKRGDLPLLPAGDRRQNTASVPGHETGSKSPNNAEMYRSTYGQNEPVAALIPFMLEAFPACYEPASESRTIANEA